MEKWINTLLENPDAHFDSMSFVSFLLSFIVLSLLNIVFFFLSVKYSLVFSFPFIIILISYNRPLFLLLLIKEVKGWL